MCTPIAKKGAAIGSWVNDETSIIYLWCFVLPMKSFLTFELLQRNWLGQWDHHFLLILLRTDDTFLTFELLLLVSQWDHHLLMLRWYLASVKIGYCGEWRRETAIGYFNYHCLVKMRLLPYRIVSTFYKIWQCSVLVVEVVYMQWKWYVRFDISNELVRGVEPWSSWRENIKRGRVK